VFERFTERARQVIALAVDEARLLRHNYVGTEHILLGLLRETDGIAARVLDSADIRIEPVRDQVLRMVGFGEEVSSAQIPFTWRAKKALELALREARSLGRDDVGTEHILLGLIDEGEGVAARILLDFDVAVEKIRSEVLRAPAGMLGESSGSAAEPVPSRFAAPPLPASGDLELGWRGRPIALAALGAAVLSRRAFDRSKTGSMHALEMQLLAQLALGPPDPTQAELGELFESLAVALACDRDDLRDAVRVLAGERLVDCQDEQDGDQRISITNAGLTAVHGWLERVVPLFGRWPPDSPAVDDAIG
jgi:Clp amino terminal domain, pathogenicity island component